MTARSEFSGSRLRLARAFKGLTQHELAELVGKTHQYIGYLEAGHKLPTDVLVDAIAQECGFAPSFLFGDPIEEFRDEDCHFRRRASTPVSVRTRVLAHGTLFAMLVTYLDEALSLPEDDVPSIRVRSREDIEQAAEACRERWGLGKDAPIKNLTRAVERAGVVVTRFEGSSTKIDAFSRSGRRSVVVLNTEKDSPSRTRFDLSHETGHLVMHGGLITGDGDSEAQADQFGSAFLMPRAGFVREFPRGARIDWPALFRLKKRWGASVAAIVRRAYDLRLIDAASYQRAYKYMAAQSWLRGEPEEIPDEEQELVPLSLVQLEKHLQATPLDVCKALRWTAQTFRTVTGIAVPEYEPPAADNTGVVQLALIRAEQATGSRPKRKGTRV
jgi:Zn-dependent peptidase ImmA (M78 family)/transcriptional regulator with XRE-family HTH domain